MQFLFQLHFKCNKGLHYDEFWPSFIKFNVERKRSASANLELYNSSLEHRL